MTAMRTKVDPIVGDYHRVLLPGRYTVEVVAEGCKAIPTQTVDVLEPEVIQPNLPFLSFYYFLLDNA